MVLFGAVVGALACVLVALAYFARERIPMDDKARAKAPGQFADLPAGKTHWLAEGPATGEVIILVPGATLPLWIWADLPGELAKAGYRVIRYDLIGRGYSDRPNVRYDNDHFVQQLNELIAALQIRTKVNLVGLAFGCLIISEFAIRHPSLVRSLCFIGPDGFGVSMARGSRLLTMPVIGSYITRVIGNRRLISRLNDYSSDRALIDWLRARYVPELKFKGFKRALLSSVRHMPIHDARDAYQKVTARLPVTVIWGALDRVTPMPKEGDLRTVLARSNVHILPEVGHLPHRERSAETLKIISEHLDRVTAAVAS